LFGYGNEKEESRFPTSNINKLASIVGKTKQSKSEILFCCGTEKEESRFPTSNINKLASIVDE